MTLPNILAEGRYLLIDIESTGLSVNTDEPVQIAFGTIDHGITGLRGYYTLRPHLAPLKEGSTAKHGFTAEKLAHSPQFAEIAAELRGFAEGRIMLGWNVLRFDYKILTRMFEGWAPTTPQLDPDVLDVFAWEKKLSPPDGGKHNLAAACERWGVSLTNYHDAWHDCRVTWQLFCVLAHRFPDFGALPPRAACADLPRKE